MNGTYGPATWANVLYFLLGDVGTHTPGEVIQSVAAAAVQLYSTILASAFSSHWAINSTTVTYRDAADSIVRLRVADAFAGTNGTGDQEAQVAYLINWATSDPRRGGKPRTYIPGVPDNAVADSARLTTGEVAAINSAIVTWLTAILTPGGSRLVAMQLVEMSFRNGGTWRDSAVTFPILGGVCNPVVATQRRRVDRLRA